MRIQTKPVKLHIGVGLSCGAEGFSERIQGNYGLLGARFTPNELLFLMTEPPEAAEAQTGMTVLVDQSGRQDTWNVAMDVVNNVVNRILLDGSERFTYQDQVYITTVLNRLGVADTERFMDQVRQLRTESESTARLLALYQKELVRFQERQGAEVPRLRLPALPEDDALPAAPAPDVELSLMILRRLDALQSVQRLYDLRRSWFHLANYFQRSELQLSEQLRFSDSVSLEETKRQIFQNSRLSLTHHLNRYELEEAPEGGEAPALSRAAAAVLSGAVDNVLVQILKRPELRQNQWLRVENALWQSGANSLARYTLYREAPPPTALAPLSRTEETVWKRYAGELREYQTLRQYLYPREEAPAAAPFPPGETAMTLLSLFAEEPEEFPAETHARPGTETVRRDVLRETDSRETDRERVERVLNTESRLPPPGRTPGASLELRHLERTETADRLRESVLETDRRQRELHRLERTLREQKIWPPAASVRERETRLERELFRRESQRTETPAPEEGLPASAPAREREAWTPPRLERRGTAPPLTLTAREAEALAPEALEEALREIDRQNRTILKSLPPESRESEPTPLPALDFRRTLKDSLRALSEPESLLRELVEKRQAEESAPPALTHREEMLLRRLPPEERRVYEAVLAYEKDPEGALAQGVLRPGSLGELYGAIRQTERPAAELTHPAAAEAEETERITERVETVLEQILGPLPRRERRTETRTPPPAVKIVHKTAPEEITEEERAKRQQTRTTVETDSRRQEVRRHEERQVDVTRQERTLVSETAEDITALVNRTLAGQMRSISDQVYRQMEKRLQMERSRRGRL